jgi:NADH-quinone oxidoreductase subunit N
MKSELILTAIIFVILFMKLAAREVTDGNYASVNTGALNIINGLLLINLLAGFFLNQSGNLFGDMFVTDHLSHFEKNLLNFGTLIISLSAYDWLRNHKYVHEFYILLLSTLLGMFFMISSGNLMMFYLGLELATIPIAALSNFDLERKRSSEAAMKMVMLSAFASGLLLFGISMFYGTTGTLSLAELPLHLDGSALQSFALILLIAGFGFKISAVPFHLWTADVYEGSPSSVTAYLSVISKAAVLFVMTSVLYNSFFPIADEWYRLITILAVATMIVGNLFAMRQGNLKRLLAFSSIAQVGFILVGMSGQSVEGSVSVLYFILIYLYSNLGAFAVITLISARTGMETLDDYRGLYKTNPLLTWVMAISLFSLAGIPPTAGFFGKFFLLIAGAAPQNYLLIIFAALNMVISLYYYLIVIKSMFISSNPNPVPPIKPGINAYIAMALCVGGIIITGIYGPVYDYIFTLVNSN